MPQPHALASTAPMEAKLVADLPPGPGWQYEPKWDGFRAIASRSGDTIELMSKSGKSLARYFPEIVAALAATSQSDFVIDGELILPVCDILSFDALQARLHPALSRIHRLSRETPAKLMLFDCLAVAGASWIDAPLKERRQRIEKFSAMENESALLLSPATLDEKVAQSWLDRSGGALDGIIAKQLSMPYLPGERAMLKIKQHRTADCVVGGFRRDRKDQYVASLLLGLYDDAGRLNHVGFTSALAAEDKPGLSTKLDALIKAPGFTGTAPGGPSRWNGGKESKWYPLRPELVVEVRYDQVTGARFRHGTALMRWRPDKAPHQCRMDQLAHALRSSELTDLQPS